MTYITSLVIYLLFPLVFVLIPSALPLFLPTLLSVALYVLFQMRSRLSFEKLLAIKHTWAVAVLVRFIALMLMLIALLVVMKFDNFFKLFHQMPILLVLIMLLYPLVSVVAQELIYRVYFFEKLFSSTQHKGAAIVVNALLFSWGHIIFHNYVALVMTFFGGILFASSYLKTRSLLLVIFEHSLYGDALFILGLGEYFYHAR